MPRPDSLKAEMPDWGIVAIGGRRFSGEFIAIVHAEQAEQRIRLIVTGDRLFRRGCRFGGGVIQGEGCF
jgi:hypothetical protein